MAIKAVLTGSLVLSEDGTTLITKTISETVITLNDYTRRRRLSIAAGETEAIEIPATSGQVLAVFLRSGTATLSVGGASAVPLASYLLMDSIAFASLSITAITNCEAEVIVGGTD